jgi:dimethylaniline monooxygenase (N-oxide forming)
LFRDTDSLADTELHNRILKGAPLGISLLEADVDFDKVYLGQLELLLPDWLKKEFSTKDNTTLALYCEIVLNNKGTGDEKPVYAQIIEVIQPGLREHFETESLPLKELDANLRSLCSFGGLVLNDGSPEAINDCIVIGAGPGGIVAVKEFLEQGVSSVVCLEQSAEMGGIFSRGYDNLILTSSVTFSMFSDFWVGDGKDHHFWSKEEAVGYWSDYAHNYGVVPHIRFNTKVEKVSTLKSGNWQVNLSSGGILVCRHLVLAIGNNNIPRYPEWSKHLSNVGFSHSRDYKNAGEFKGKNVLVVGGGESGSDVAYEISQVAAQSWVSLRDSSGWIVPRRRGGHAADVSTHRGIWDLPRDYGKILSPFVLKLERARKDPVFDVLAELNEKISVERGIWGIYGTKTLALPKAVAYHGCKVVGGITRVEDGGRRLHTACGEVIEDLDAIVFCTGYVNRVDFMPESLRQCDPRKMFKHMLHPEYGDRIIWIGWARPGFGSQFPIMEMQARYAALLFSKKMNLPSREAMTESIQQDYHTYREQFEDNADRIRSLVDYHGFMNGMARLIGCFPPLTRYFFLRPGLWLHLMYGPTQATQFRLRGPGKKVKLAHQILRKLPVSTFNHIVKAGLRGRVRYGLRALIPKARKVREIRQPQTT